MKILSALAIVLALFTFSSCKSDKEDPKKVLTLFFEALSKNDIQTARQYTTAESAKMMDLLAKGVEKDKSEKTKFNTENIEFGKVEINGDQAIVPVKEKGKEISVNYILKKENGWKVAFDKGSLMNMSKDAIKSNSLPDSLTRKIDKLNMNMDSLIQENN
ncbi:MAG: DUF4878 domain-containing protein [Bacteroidetes bacterium]|nr:DUF4878 domain-containing protein [Bacteroidota bacterium]